VSVQAVDGFAAPGAKNLAVSDADGLAVHDAIVLARTLLPTAPPLKVDYDVTIVGVQR
jgi:hypothetical protein